MKNEESILLLLNFAANCKYIFPCQNIKKCSTRSAHYFDIKWTNFVLGYAFLLLCVRQEFDAQFKTEQRQKAKLLA